MKRKVSFVIVQFIAGLLLGGFLLAQNPYPPINQPVFRALDANGKPLSGGKLWTYAAGSSTLLPTYTSAGGTQPNANPVVLSSTGEGIIFMGPSLYKFVLTDANDVQQWSIDNINGAPPPPAVSSVFGRTGAVVAVSGDYTCGQVTGAVCSIPTLHYQTVQANGAAQAQRDNLNLKNGTNITVSCADNAGANSTDCTITAPGAGGTPRTCNSIGCYQIDPDGTIKQWVTGTTSFTGRGQTSITWPIPFPTSCSNVQVTPQFNSHLSSGNWQGAAFYVQPDDCKSAVQLYVDIRGDGSVDAPFHAMVYGVGW